MVRQEAKRSRTTYCLTYIYKSKHMQDIYIKVSFKQYDMISSEALITTVCV